MTLLLQGGTVVDPSQKLEKRLDLLVEKGRVAALGKIKPGPIPWSSEPAIRPERRV